MTQNCQTLATFYSEIILKNNSMTISNRRIQANRQNALQSTGPRTAAGKVTLTAKPIGPTGSEA